MKVEENGDRDMKFIGKVNALILVKISEKRYVQRPSGENILSGNYQNKPTYTLTTTFELLLTILNGNLGSTGTNFSLSDIF